MPALGDDDQGAEEPGLVLVGRRGWDVEGGHAVWGWTGMTRTARESRSAT